MSNVTYTAEQVEKMIAEKLAEQKALLSKSSSKAVSFSHNSGVFKTRKGEEKAFSNIRIQGPFYPTSLSYSAAKAILANYADFEAIVKAQPVEAPKAPVSALAPRLAKS